MTTWINSSMCRNLCIRSKGEEHGGENDSD